MSDEYNCPNCGADWTADPRCEAATQLGSLSNYQAHALRTEDTTRPLRERLTHASMGLAGEAGEVVDLLKKYVFHGHDFDSAKVRDELGDVLWYVAALAAACELSLDEVAEHNAAKLRARYPDGFSEEASRGREAVMLTCGAKCPDRVENASDEASGGRRDRPVCDLCGNVYGVGEHAHGFMCRLCRGA